MQMIEPPAPQFVQKKISVTEWMLSSSAGFWILMLLGGATIAVLLFMGGDEKKGNPNPNPSVGKEHEFLRFNKDAIMKNLIAAEEHLRNVKDKTQTVEQGALSCVVKHLASSESHAEEGVSHAAVVEGDEVSNRFAKLAEDIKDARYEVQRGVEPAEGIRLVRKVRREFESFNPEFDVTRCKACTVHK